ncbi:MAG: GMC family oxidoreductase N-terminal domain-containing protein [Syntrophomonas sp.]
MKKAVVVGSGAGGATVAKELQGKFAVTVLEAGKAFQPFSWNLSTLGKLKKTGLFLDEQMIQLLFPTMKIRKTSDKMILVNGVGVGGTTTISAGNALRVDDDLRRLGIDLDAQFEEIYREIPITTHHQRLWNKTTRRLFEICEQMDLIPKPTPKMGYYERCTRCGKCVLGCGQGVKWDSRQFLDMAVDHGADIKTGCKVESVVIENGKARGVIARQGWKSVFYPADLVVLAAGGFGTPVILNNSGIECENRLFVDPVLCVAAEWRKSHQNTEVSMPFVVQKEHFILSPYFDHLSFFFNKDWRYPANSIVSMMIKLADVNTGSVAPKKIDKPLTDKDKERLNEGVEICSEILSRLGAKRDSLFLGTLNAGHPGGMMPLTEKEADTLHDRRLPANLYIADSTLFPVSLGNPPILTIIALAKKISSLCMQSV